MAADPFQPFETTLDRNATLKVLQDAAHGADDGELFLERCRSEVLSFDDRRLKTASFDASQGFGLRVIRGEATGYAHSSTIQAPALRRAAAAVRLAVGDGGGTFAAGPGITDRKLYADTDPTLSAEFSEKVKLLGEIDAFARGLDPHVVQVSATLAGSHQEVTILRPDGMIYSDARPLSRLSISVIVEQNGRRESGFAGGGGRGAPEALLEPAHWQATTREALRIALVNLKAKPAPAGVMDVVLGPGWPGILLHEAVGHGLEGDANRKGSSAFAGLMGQRVATKGVTVLDDGTIPNRRGSISIDDEGTPSRKNVLINDGVLVGFMQDRQNARLMGVAPTGNGRRQSYAHAPMPRMTNTYMLAGDADPDAMMAQVRDGLFAVGFGGGQVDITNGKFVFSCTEAYQIKNGIVGAPVKGATLIGDGPTALQQIRAIGNDLHLDPGVGTCGKAGQWVPVGVGQPSLLIGGLTVGGAAA